MGSSLTEKIYAFKAELTDNIENQFLPRVTSLVLT